MERCECNKNVLHCKKFKLNCGLLWVILKTNFKRTPNEDLKDALQSAKAEFVNFERNGGTSEDEPSKFWWIYRAAKRDLLDMKKKRKPAIIEEIAHKKNIEPESLLTTLGPRCNPYDQIDAQLSLQTLLNELSEKDREIIVMHSLEGYTFNQIAQKNGEKIDTLKKRFKRAFHKLVEIAHETPKYNKKGVTKK